MTTITYDYDPLYRLSSATYSSGEVYTYDAVGNRLAMGAGGEVSAYTYDAANRLTSVDGVGYTWDDGDQGFGFAHHMGGGRVGP